MSSRQFMQRLIHASALAVLISAAGAGAAPKQQRASDAIEGEPTLKLADFRGLPPGSGRGYRIDPGVPVTGYMGQFTLHTDLGDLKADGAGMLKQRVAEVGPSLALQKLSSSDVFVDAMSKSAQSGAKAIGTAVTHPVDTIQAVPAGLGRFFKSVGQSVDSAVTSTSQGDTTDAAKDALGINKAKRQLAKNVGVDPYTTNPYVAKRLDDLANAAFAGGVSLDVVLAVSTAGVATAISVTKTVSNLAWDLPPADIRERNDADLAALTVDGGTRTQLLDNRWYTPTMALSFVEALKGLGVRDGDTAFTALAASSQNEAEARFFIAQLRLAQHYVKEGGVIVAMEVLGKIGAFRTRGGGLFIPVPLDYLSWTEDVKAFVEGNGLQGQREVWFTGRPSPRAAAQLRERGTRFREYVVVD